MNAQRTLQWLVVLGTCAALVACEEQSEGPAAVSQDDPSMQAAHGMHSMASAAAPDLGPFTFRAPLAPYRIHQLPNFLMHSRERSDIVIQRSVFAPGAGPWHTHPGPSFIYVIMGNIKLDRVNDGRCTSTRVFSPGEAYTETANEVHRAVVTSEEPAVVLVTRFNIPPGAPITVMAADPGC